MAGAAHRHRCAAKTEALVRVLTPEPKENMDVVVAEARAEPAATEVTRQPLWVPSPCLREAANSGSCKEGLVADAATMMQSEGRCRFLRY